MKAYIKKLPIVLALGLLGASLAFGQDPATSGQSQSPSSSTEANTVQGCLSGSDGNYTLTQDGTGTTFKLMGNEDQLKKHVGHEVAIKGEVSGNSGSMGSSPSAGAGQESQPSSASGSTAPSLQVSSVKMLARDCTSAASPPTR